MTILLRLPQYLWHRLLHRFLWFLAQLDRLIVFIIFPIARFIALFPPNVYGPAQKILVCGYRDTKARKNDSVEAHTLFRSLQKSILKEQISFFYQDRRFFASICWLIVLWKENPSKIILSSYSHKSPFNPSVLSLKLAKKVGVELIFLWWDTCSTSFFSENKKVLEIASKNVVVDNPKKLFFPANSITDKIIFTHSPVLVDDVVPSICSREIGLFFSGATKDYRSIRNEYLQKLTESSFSEDVLIAKNLNLTYEKYRDSLRNSAVAISFPESVDCDQLKARVLEITGSGALLIERENEQTPCLFEEGKDFISFKNADDLVSKVEKILKCKSEYNKIANNGYQKAKMLCDVNEYWKKIIY